MIYDSDEEAEAMKHSPPSRIRIKKQASSLLSQPVKTFPLQCKSNLVFHPHNTSIGYAVTSKGLCKLDLAGNNVLKEFPFPEEPTKYRRTLLMDSKDFLWTVRDSKYLSKFDLDLQEI